MRSLQFYNFWYGKDSNTEINVECLLPNGIYIQFPDVKADTPLERIKTELWKEAASCALYKLLKPRDQYVFVVVSNAGGTEELIDETLSLFDVKPVKPYLKIVQRKGNDALKLINSKINLLIGRTITPALKDPEVDDMRRVFLPYCEKICHQRGCSSWERRAIYSYPPEFDDNDRLPDKLSQKLQVNRNHIQVSMRSGNSTLKHIVKTVEINEGTTPQNLIDIALRKRAQTLNEGFVEQIEDYVLKVCGRNSFFLGQIEVIEGKEYYFERPMVQYKYIRDCLQWDKIPTVMIVKKHELDVGRLNAPSHMHDTPPSLPEKGKAHRICLWDLNRAHKLKVKIVFAMNVNAGHMWKEVQCCIFHGGEEVCEIQTTSVKNAAHLTWNESLEFDLCVADLPRMARFCFSIVGYHQRDTKKKKPALIAWVNVPVFNYKGILRSGSDRLYCWQSNISSGMNSGTNSIANPLRTVRQSDSDNGPCIGVVFMEFEHPVMYPLDSVIYEVAAKSVQRDTTSDRHPYLVRGGRMKKQVEEVVNRDPLSEMTEQDKELLWFLRADCYHEFPRSLPKLLQCVKWSSHEYVAEMRFLLQSWRKEDLEVEIALDLLDYRFPDLAVREFAVAVLGRLSDTELEMYLLHLVQALKYESYLNSDLARYLLERALNNRRIGHFLFWHLKCEVSNPEYCVQFGLLLEMYCRGAVEHIDILYRQVEAINKMKTVTEVLQAANAKDYDDKRKLQLMKECFNSATFVKAFSNIVSPLDPSVRLKCLKVDKCKYMDSKKKPLWLVFENEDEDADDVLIMFKNGDDLRQDTLTLLSMRLMDNVWKKAGLDFGLNIYQCLPTGANVGLIAIVPESDTLGRIQANLGGSVMGVWQEDTLYLYLKDKCSTDEKMQDFIENFTMSVVGYSVATYVLGIGDRHNDNIMLKHDRGQLFHIDFGHFLGNFKSKFGIKRERVKFVLTNDMVYVIKKKKNEEESFERFRNLCIEAFKALRCKGDLFITVFAMLLSTGIPELEHPHDLDYLRNTLAVDLEEPDAINHFGLAFREALANRAATTTNWMIHNLKHRWITS